MDFNIKENIILLVRLYLSILNIFEFWFFRENFYFYYRLKIYIVIFNCSLLELGNSSIECFREY